MGAQELLSVKAWQEIGADTLTIFWGEWLDLRARLAQIAATGLISPLIYVLAFGLGLGRVVDAAGAPPAGDNYLQFILPGMVALSSMAISFGGTTFSICGDRLFNKTFEEFLLVPVHPLALHLGRMLAGVLRGMLTAAAVMVVAILFTGKILSFLNPLFLVVLALNCAVFAGVGVLVGLSVKSLEVVGLYNNFLIVPMSFLGATFFDPGTLPPLFRIVVYCLPLTHATTALRAAAYLPPSQFPWYSLLVLAGFALILAVLGARQFSRLQD